MLTTEKKSEQQKAGNGSYLVPLLVLAIAIGQQLFFSFGFIGQAVYPLLEIEGMYSVYLAGLAIFAVIYFEKRLAIDGCSLSRASWLLLMLAFAVLVLALIHRESYSSTWDFFEYYLVICLPALFMGVCLDREGGKAILQKMVKLADPVMVVITVAVCVYELVNYSTSSFTVRALANATYQQVSYMGALAFGINLAMLITSAQYRFGVFCTPFFRALQVLLLIVQTVCVAVSGGRGGFLLLCIYVAMFIWVAARHGRDKAPKLLVAFLASMLCGAALLVFGIVDPSAITGTKGFSRIFTHVDNRSDLYGTALEMIAMHPVFGYGVGGYISELRGYPHNLFLEVLLNWGLAGLVAFLVVISCAVYSLMRFTRENDWFVVLLFISMSPVVYLMFSSSFMANATLWFFAGLAFSPLCCLSGKARFGKKCSS